MVTRVNGGDIYLLESLGKHVEFQIIKLNRGWHSLGGLTSQS
jgi:hypothetical protein